MDYRLPGLDGVQATRAVVASCPGTTRRRLTASANRARDRRRSRRRRRRLPDEGPGPRRDRRGDPRAPAARGRREADRREHRGRPRLDRRLPGGRRALPELARSCRCTCASATRATATTSSSGRTSSTSGCATRARAADDLAADAGRLPSRPTRSSPQLRAHPLAPHPGDALRHVRRARGAAAEELGGGKVRAIDTRHRVRRGSAMLALAIQRRLERGTTDEEIDALVDALQGERRDPLHGRHARVPRRGGRIGRAAAFAGQLLNVKPILDDRGRRGRPAEARARAARRRSPSFSSSSSTRRSTTDHLRVGHRARRRARARPNARASSSRASGRRRRSRSRRRSARSSARTPARGPSASSGSRTTGVTVRTAFLYSDRLWRRDDTDPHRSGFHGRGPARALATPARSSLGPSASTAAGRRCRGSASRSRSGSRKLGLATVGDLLRARAAPLRARRRRELAIAELFGEEEVAISGVVRSVAHAAARGRLTIVTARVADESGHDRRRLVQPGLARRQAAARHARAPARPAPPQRLRRQELRPRRDDADRRLRAGLPGERGGDHEAAARARASRRSPYANDVGRPAARDAARAARAADPRATRSSRSTARRSRGGRRARTATARVRRAPRAAARAGARASRPRGREGARARRARRADRALPRARCRSR